MTHELRREHGGDEDPKIAIKEWATERISWIKELVTELHGEGARVEDKFPPPTQPRDDAPDPEWTPEQEARAREVAQRFGYGAEYDVPSGLTGGIRIAEGGKVWKIMAEAEAIRAEEQVASVVFAGSPHRKLGQDEITFLQEKHGLNLPEGATEHDAAQWIAERFADESVHDEPQVLEFGYQVAEGNPVVREATGQLVRIGQASGGQSVELLRIDRENYQDEAGDPKYRHQPNTSRLLTMFSERLSMQDDETSPVAIVTSNTYASRQFATLQAGLQHGRPFAEVFYGRQTLRSLDAPVPAEMPRHHLPGDLRMAYEALRELEQLLGRAES